MRTFAIVLAVTLFCGIVRAKDQPIQDMFNGSSEEELDLSVDEELLKLVTEQKHVEQGQVYEKKHIEDVLSRRPALTDPCAAIHCSAGKICQADGDSAQCVCIPECPEEKDPRRRVCTSRNETWDSDCEVHRQRCLCDTKHALCRSKEFTHIQIDYLGECRDMPTCTEEEMNDFPRRMRDWLFNVMRDLADRQELTDHYKMMKEEAETNMTKRWVNAAVWKWCDLDASHDHSVSIHELFPIRAPLMSLEHCIAPFLLSCDPNGDHRITLQEWGMCLEIPEEELIEQCDDVRNSTDDVPVAME